MSMRIKTKVNVRVWEEAEQFNLLYGPDDKLQETVIDNMQIVNSGLLAIEDETDMDLPLPDLQTVQGLHIRSDQDVVITINAGDPITLIRPSAGSTDAPTHCSLFIEATITSLNIAKPATTPAATANVRFVVWGNPEE